MSLPLRNVADVTSLIDAGPPPAPTPTQLRVASELFDREGQRPTFDADLGPELTRLLEDGLGPVVADRQPADALFLSKRIVGQVHACEGWLLAERDQPFAWSAPAARGTCPRT